MDPILVGGLVAFGVVGVALSIAWGSSTLSKLEPLAGEQTSFELTGLTVSQHSVGAPSNFINCVVRVTNRRIIVAQKALLSRDPSLRFVITHDAEVGSQAELGGTLAKGYIASSVGPAEIEIQSDPPLVVLPLRGGAIVGQQRIHIPIQDPSPWESLKRPRS